MTDAIPTPPPAEFDEPTEVDASILAYNRSGTAHELEGFQLGWLAARRQAHAELAALRAELLTAKRDARTLKKWLAEAANALESRAVEEASPEHLKCSICDALDDHEAGQQHTAECFISQCRALAEQEVG